MAGTYRKSWQGNPYQVGPTPTLIKGLPNSLKGDAYVCKVTDESHKIHTRLYYVIATGFAIIREYGTIFLKNIIRIFPYFDPPLRVFRKDVC